MRELLARCLEKDPRKRRRDIGDLGFELEALLTRPSPSSSLPTILRRFWLISAAAVIGLSAAVGFVTWQTKPTPPRPLRRFEIAPPRGQQPQQHKSSRARAVASRNPLGLQRQRSAFPTTTRSNRRRADPRYGERERAFLLPRWRLDRLFGGWVLEEDSHLRRHTDNAVRGGELFRRELGRGRDDRLQPRRGRYLRGPGKRRRTAATRRWTGRIGRRTKKAGRWKGSTLHTWRGLSLGRSVDSGRATRHGRTEDPDPGWGRCSISADRSSRLCGGDDALCRFQPFPGPGERGQISRNAGLFPIWSPAGEIFYEALSGGVVSVEVRLEPELQVSSPRALFEVPTKVPRGGAGGSGRNWDVMPDGERFVFVVNAEQDPDDRPAIQFVTNWIEELQRLVPTAK